MVSVHFTRRRGRARARGGAPALLLALVPLAACSDYLDDVITVEAPDRVIDRAIDDPGSAGLLVRSVQATFECAFGAYVTGFGLIGDELMESAGNVGLFAFDRREVTANEGLGGVYASGDCPQLGLYTPVSSARWFADDVLRRLESWSDAQVANRASLIATAAAYSGYAHILLGEGFCTAAVDGGPELSRAQVFALAEERFTTALAAAQASSNAAMLGMARVGRARARLNLGMLMEAAADAELVPAGFVRNMTAAEGIAFRENRVFVYNVRQRNLGVEPGFRNLEWQGEPDPRVPVRDGGTHPTSQLPYFFQDKYTTAATPIPIASHDEALLIIAEVRGGAEAVAIINGFHQRAGLPPFQSDDADEIAAHVREERRRELFLEGHRINDIIRFQLALTPEPGTPYHWGGVYGSTTCLPLPDRERLNNPNIS